MILRLAHEAPIKNIKLVQSLTDLDFAIAHFTLRYPKYAIAFADRPKGRILIMDNGQFELSSPISQERVLMAAELTQADYVISPDITFSKRDTLQHLTKFLALNESRFRVGAVICGDSVLEQYACYQTYTSLPVDMYCFSFLHSNRAEVLEMLFQNKTYDFTKPHHLLGFSSYEELARCTANFPSSLSLSLDTMKPISAAFHQTCVGYGDQRGKFTRPEITETGICEEMLSRSVQAFAKNVRR